MTDQDVCSSRLRRRMSLGRSPSPCAARVGLRAASIARSERGAEQSTSSCVWLRQLAEVLSTSTDALRGFPNDPGPVPDRRNPVRALSCAGVTLFLHTASL
jgi:hypothetical protein